MANNKTGVLSLKNDVVFKAVTDRRELIDIEMQMFWQEELRNRLIVYHGGLIHESLRKGEPYGEMRKTITVCIMDSELFHESEQYINRFFLMEEKEKYIFSDKTMICCIELPKVNRSGKSVAELTPLGICLEYLKHADENGGEYVDELIRRGGKELQMTQMLLERATEDDVLREKALAREKLKQDIISGMYGSYQKGLLEGSAKMAREIALKMKLSGTSVEEVAGMTGLSIEEIELL